MKRKVFLLIGIPALVLGFAFQSAQTQTGDDLPGINIPQPVQTILNKSCMPCHGSKDGNFKAKTKLNIDKLYSLNRSKLINKLGEISDEVQEGSMPKKKFVSKHPEAALTSDEQKTLVDWANSQADQLVGE